MKQWKRMFIFINENGGDFEFFLVQLVVSKRYIQTEIL